MEREQAKLTVKPAPSFDHERREKETSESVTKQAVRIQKRRYSHGAEWRVERREEAERVVAAAHHSM